MIFECIFAPFWPRRWAVSLTNFETTFVCRSAFFWGTSTPTVASVGTQEARTQDQTASVQPARGREGRLPARCQGAVSRVASTRRSTRTRSVMIRTQEAVAHLITHRPLSFQKDSPPWSCLLKNNKKKDFLPPFPSGFRIQTAFIRRIEVQLSAFIVMKRA